MELQPKFRYFTNGRQVRLQLQFTAVRILVVSTPKSSLYNIAVLKT